MRKKFSKLLKVLRGPSVSVGRVKGLAVIGSQNSCTVNLDWGPYSMSERMIDVCGSACKIQVYRVAKNIGSQRASIWENISERVEAVRQEPLQPGEKLRNSGSRNGRLLGSIGHVQDYSDRRLYECKSRRIHLYRSLRFVAGLCSKRPQDKYPSCLISNMPVVFPARPA